MTMSRHQTVVLESDETEYRQDDIARSLRIAMSSVFVDALANNETNPAFLRGVLALAEWLAALYCMPWEAVLTDLREKSALYLLEERLQKGDRHN